MIFMGFVSFRWLTLLVCDSTFVQLWNSPLVGIRGDVSGGGGPPPGVENFQAISVFSASASC